MKFDKTVNKHFHKTFNKFTIKNQRNEGLRKAYASKIYLWRHMMNDRKIIMFRE